MAYVLAGRELSTKTAVNDVQRLFLRVYPLSGLISCNDDYRDSKECGTEGKRGMSEEMREGIWDIHTHCLPGIDDGARNWDIAMQMLQASWETGVRTVIATPHYLPWREPTPAESIRGLCLEAMERCRRELGIEMAILPGAELYYYDDIVEDLKSGRALTMADSRTVLVEFSEQVPWSELSAGITRIRRSGYQPILAHAERYQCLRRSDHFQDILSRGILIQSNAQEIEGGLFNNMTRWVTRQYRERVIDFVASDMHNLDSRPPLSEKQIKWFRRNFDDEYFRRLFGEGIRRQLRQSF